MKAKSVAIGLVTFVGGVYAENKVQEWASERQPNGQPRIAYGNKYVIAPVVALGVPGYLIGGPIGVGLIAAGMLPAALVGIGAGAYAIAGLFGETRV